VRVDTKVPGRLLVVDDDQRLRTLLEKYLKEHGFDVITAPNAKQARLILADKTFDLMILDVMMPEETGFSFIESIRQDKKITNPDIPVLLLTAMGESKDRITGLEKGADDYLIKPFEPKELLLRIQTILRRAKPMHMQKKIIHLGKRSYDMRRQTLYEGDVPIALSTVETNLLHILAENAGETVSRDELARRSGVELSPRTVDVQVTRLRKKIEEDPRKPYYIRTIRHQGYILWPDSH